MRIILVGYGEMASELLLGLKEAGHDIVGVLRWNRAKMHPAMRFLMDYFNPEKFYSIIKQLKIKELNAKSINSEKFFKEALKLQPDIIIVGSWGEIIDKRIIDLPRIASINVHPSLLPKYRGPNPYIETIRNGEEQTGVSFHLLDKKLDAGAILAQEKINISDKDTGESLRIKCTYKARSMIKNLLEQMEQGDILPTIQDENEASYFPRITIKDAVIDWKKPAKEIYNQVRALYPWQSCYSLHQNKFLKFSAAKILDAKTKKTPGTILAKDKNISVAAGDGKIILIEKPQIYGLFGALFGKIYIRSKIKIGDILEKF